MTVRKVVTTVATALFVAVLLLAVVWPMVEAFNWCRANGGSFGVCLVVSG